MLRTAMSVCTGHSRRLRSYEDVGTCKELPYACNIEMSQRVVTCCAEEEVVLTDHPTSCLGPQTTESALRTQLSYQQTSEQHWLDAVSWQSSLD